MPEQQESPFSQPSLREAPLRITDFASSATVSNVEEKTPYQMVHEMGFEEYSFYCNKIAEAGIDRNVTNDDLLARLSSFQPRFDGEFIIPTLRTIRDIDAKRAERFDKEKQDLKHAVQDSTGLRDFKINWVNNYADQMRKIYGSSSSVEVDWAISGVFINQLSYFFEEGFTPSQIRPTIEFFAENFAVFKDNLFPAYIKQFFKKGMIASNLGKDELKMDSRSEVSRDVLSLAIDVFEDPQSTPHLRRVAIEGLAVAQSDSDNKDIRAFADSYLAYQVKKFGIDPEPILRVWSQNYDDPDPELSARYPEFIAKNFDVMAKLEAERPGICQVLYKEFGIHNFSRYPLKALIDQYDYRDRDMPYGVLIYPHSDNNGAFNNPEVLDDLFTDVDHARYGLRIYESGSGFGTLRRLGEANGRYGGLNKISFVVIGGHGAKDQIAFGKSIEHRLPEYPDIRNHKVDKKDLRGTVSRAGMKDWFIKHPRIVLNSCSTGLDSGIGNEIYEIGADITAPKVPAAIKNISMGKRSNGTLWFAVEYILTDKKGIPIKITKYIPKGEVDPYSKEEREEELKKALEFSGRFRRSPYRDN